MSFEEILKTFTFGQIFLFIVAALASLKYSIETIKWGVNSFKKIANHGDDINNRFNVDEERIQKLEKTSALVELLIESEKDDIKAWITEQHHKWCYSKSKTIDAYSLQCIKNRYKHYKAMGGNSFIEDLMKDIEKLTIYTPNPEDLNKERDSQ